MRDWNVSNNVGVGWKFVTGFGAVERLDVFLRIDGDVSVDVHMDVGRLSVLFADVCQ